MYCQLCLVQIVRIFHTKNQKIKKMYEGLAHNRLKLHTFREFFMILYDSSLGRVDVVVSLFSGIFEKKSESQSAAA